MSLLRSPWVSGGLAAVALGIVAYQVLSSGRSRPRAVKSAPAVAPPSAARAIPAPQPKPVAPLPESPEPATKPGPTPIDRQFVQSHFADWIESPRRDPFQNATTNLALLPPSPVPGWKLSAIWRQTGGRVATINGVLYQEGDVIEGYRIDRIEGDQVWFRGPTGSEPLGFGSRPMETNASPNGTNAASRPESPKKPYRKIPFVEQ